MIDPFDSEFLSQELRESWKKIEELEKENKLLKERNMDLTKEVMRLGKIILEQEEELDFYKRQEELDIERMEYDDDLRDWNSIQYGDMY
jgi:predicted RNase H-like nuclease (RuvC/YqgF family)